MPHAQPPRGVRIWDLPTRICHWALAACVGGAFVTQAIGGNAMVWHGRCGLAVLGLLTFRIVWGFAGSTYARFAQFVRGPAAIRAYLRGEWQGAGHNPLGALSVLALLATLAWLATTGLFANDDIAFNGPLYALADKELSDRLTALHKLAEPALMLLVLLHIAAIAWYVRVRKDNLVKPMITGWKDDAPSTVPAAAGGSLLAFIVALALAAAAVTAASGAMLPPPPPAPATPSW
jgi:cytochrome b